MSTGHVTVLKPPRKLRPALGVSQWVARAKKALNTSDPEHPDLPAAVALAVLLYAVGWDEDAAARRAHRALARQQVASVLFEEVAA